METETAVTALGALAHCHRLEVFRLLVRMGPDGMAAGAISQRVGIGATAASFHLKELERAGLIRGTRDGRSIRYAVNVEGMRGLLAFLAEDCCQGQLELCGPGMAQSILCCSQEDEMATRQIFNVLFLCTHNSARSIIAECVMNRLGAGRFRAYSAGSAPSGQVHTYAIDVLRLLDYDVSQLRSKSWDEFEKPGAPEFDFIFTVCDNAANETCPVWPGHPITAHWGLPDPSAAVGTDAEKHVAFDETHRMLHQRISIFVNLPLQDIDAISLPHKLAAIGRGETLDHN